jgi:gas vesicle protein
MRTTILRPNYIVELKSTVKGGIAYNREDLNCENTNGTEVSQWQTTRTIDDKEEYELAIKTRGKATSEIRKVCHATSFGLLCPLDKGKELEEAIKEAKRIAREFNDQAQYSRVDIYTLKGEISTSDREAVRTISNEVMTLIAKMEEGINNLDVNKIRTVANDAKQIVDTLENEQSELLSDAIKQARKAARTIVKRIEKEGEQAEAVMAEVKRNVLIKARMAFLDYSEEAEEELQNEDTMPAVQPQRFAGLDVSEGVA